MTMMACLGRGTPDFRNLIRNGSFRAHIDGWYPASAGVDLSWNAMPTHSEGGALVIESSGNPMISYRPGGAVTIRLNGAATLDCVGYARSANTDAKAKLLVAFSDEFGAHGYGASFVPNFSGVTLDDTDWHEIALRNIAVPVGATHAAVGIWLSSMNGTDPVLMSDIYLGVAGGDAPPYPPSASLPLATNRLPGGDFETDAEIWIRVQNNETVEVDHTAPITGTGSLKVTVPGEFDSEGAELDLGGSGFVVVPGETIQVGFAVKGDVPLICFARFTGVDDLTVWEGTPTGTPQTVTNDVVVPAGSYAATLAWWTTEVAAGSFWIDDGSVGSAS